MSDSKSGGSGRTGRTASPSNSNVAASGMDEQSAALFGGNVTVLRNSRFEMASRAILGKTLSDADVAEMTGAMSGATVNITTWRSSAGVENVIFAISHPDLIDESVRTLSRHPNGTTELHLDYLVLRPEAQGGGKGARILGREVRAAERLGIDKITLTAGGFPGGSMNGYYTWPRLGFNAPLEEYHRRKFNAPDLHTLFRQPGGAEKWKLGGNEMDMEFNPRRRSPHRQVLDAYLREKGIRLG